MNRKGEDMAKEVKKTEKKRSPLIPWGREHDIDQMFEDFLGRRVRPFWPERWWPAAGMEITTPTVDLYEEKDDIVVKAELPGMEKAAYAHGRWSDGWNDGARRDGDDVRIVER